MPVNAPSCSNTALVPIVVPCSTWSIAGRGRSKRAHSSPIPATTPRDGSSRVVGVLWIKVRPDSVSANTTSVKVPPTSTPIRYILPSYSLARVRAEPVASSAHCHDTQQTRTNHKEGQPCRRRTQGVDHRGCGIRLHRFEFERQRVQRADRLRGSRNLVVRQGKAEKRDADQARCDNWHNDVPNSLPASCTQVASRFFICRVETVEHRQHNQQAKRQGPGEMGAQCRAVPGPLDPEHLEHRPNAEADHDRRHHQAGDDDVEQGGGAGKTPAVGEASKEGEQHRRYHHHCAESDRTIETSPDVADRLRPKELSEPMQRYTIHRKYEPALRPLKGEHHDGRDRAVKEHDKEPEESREPVEDRRTSGAVHPHSSLRMSTTLTRMAIMAITASSSTIAFAAAGGNWRYESWVAICLPTDGTCPPPSTSTVTKSPITMAITNIEPIAIPDFDSGRITVHSTCSVLAPASVAASTRARSIRIIELKIGTIIISM